MARLSTHTFRRLRALLMRTRHGWLALSQGVLVGEGAELSLSSRVVSRQRGSVTVGEHTLVAFKVLISSYDPVTGQTRPVQIGRNCFIGGGSTLLPGVTIGDESIVGAGAVVFEDVPDRCVVGGNPAKVLRRDIKVGRRGRFLDAEENTQRLIEMQLAGIDPRAANRPR